MPKSVFRILSSVLIVALAIVVANQRLSIARLQKEIESLRQTSEQSPEPLPENTPIQAPQSEAQPKEPSVELLRLRGEIGRLKQAEREAEQLRDEVAILRQQIRALSGPTRNETYGMTGLATNNLPEVEPGTAWPEVLKELRRVSAKFLEANEEFIHAQAFPSILASSNGQLPPSQWSSISEKVNCSVARTPPSPGPRARLNNFRYDHISN